MKTSNLLKLGAVLFSGLFVLSACGSADAEPQVTVTETVAPTPDAEPYEPELTLEDLYLLNVRTWGNPLIDSASDSELLDLGYTICEVFDTGNSLEDVLEFLIYDAGYNSSDEQEMIGLTIGAAVTSLCEQHYDMVNNFVN